MSVYQKNIIYLYMYKNGIKMTNAGFVKMEHLEKQYGLYAGIKGAGANVNGEYDVYMKSEKEDAKMCVGRISLQRGYGDFKVVWNTGHVEDVEKMWNAFEIIDIPLAPGIALMGANRVQVSEILEVYETDKWQELIRTYQNVNPFGDGRSYISIGPKDITILCEEYQNLSGNSFLLHGFYNYRHLILGKEEETYYIGVPGTYHEREKKVAVMFGFEAFESDIKEPSEGTFGYYMKRVRI